MLKIKKMPKSAYDLLLTKDKKAPGTIFLCYDDSGNSIYCEGECYGEDVDIDGIQKSIDELQLEIDENSAYIQNLTVSSLKFVSINKLPTVGNKSTLYFVPSTNKETNNEYTEYMYIGDKWEIVGSTPITDYINSVNVIGNGNAITSMNKAENGIIAYKNKTFLTEHPNILLGENTSDEKILNYAESFDVIDSVEQDENGHMIGLNKTTITLPSGSDVDLTNYYTKDEIYNKEQVNTAIAKAQLEESEVDLSDYYTKSQTYSKDEVNNIVPTVHDGVSPTVTITKNTNNSVISITDVNGTKTTTITNGQDGLKGENGADGYSPTATVTQTDNGATISVTDKNGITTANITNGLNGENGLQGDDGLSAYEVAVKNGYVGTETEWLVSLKGEKGDSGEGTDISLEEMPIIGSYDGLTCNTVADGVDGCINLIELKGRTILNGSPSLTEDNTFTSVTKFYESNSDEDEFNVITYSSELCSIGDISDKLIKKDEWYVEKNFVKVVLDGSEEWRREQHGATLFVFSLYTSFVLDGSVSAVDGIINNRFKVANFNDAVSTENDLSITMSGQYLVVQYSDITTVEDFKSWLSEHNLTLIVKQPLVNIKIADSVQEQLSNLTSSNSFSLNTNIETSIKFEYPKNANGSKFLKSINDIAINNVGVLRGENVVDNVTSTDTKNPLSANMGKVLSDRIEQNMESVETIEEVTNNVAKIGTLESSSYLTNIQGGVKGSINIYNIEGNLIQNGTPTMDSPVAFSEPVMFVCKSNLLKTIIKSQYKNGVDVVVGKDKSITLLGEATDDINIILGVAHLTKGISYKININSYYGYIKYSGLNGDDTLLNENKTVIPTIDCDVVFYINISSGSVMPTNVSFYTSVYCSSISVNYEGFNGIVLDKELYRTSTYTNTYDSLCRAENVFLDNENATIHVGDWYINKNIDELIVNGTEEWEIDTFGSNNTYYTYQFSIKDMPDLGNETKYFASLSTHFKYYNSMLYDESYCGFTIIQAFGHLYFKVRCNITSLDEFKVWLSNNNVTVYYRMTETKTYRLSDEQQELMSQFSIVGSNDYIYTNIDTNISLNYPLNESGANVINAMNKVSYSDLKMSSINPTATGTFSVNRYKYSDIGEKSIAIGTSSSATGSNSCVFGGTYNISNGEASVIVGGNSCTAEEPQTAILGGNANCTNSFASAIIGGGYNYTEGESSIIVGGHHNYTKAHEEDSNYNVITDSTGSIILGGQYNTTTSPNQVVMGRCNKETNSVFVIGNGNDEYERSNLFEITIEGKIISNGKDLSATIREEITSDDVVSALGYSPINNTIDRNIIPDSDNTYSIGTSEKRLASVYAEEVHIGNSTLYIGDTPVMGYDSEESSIKIHGDADQSLVLQTSGVGNISINSEQGVDIRSKGVSNNIGIIAEGATSNIVETATGTITHNATSHLMNESSVQITDKAPNINLRGAVDIVGGLATDNLTVSGNLTVNGTQTFLNTQTLNVKDNIININEGEVGNGVTSGSAGIKIDRGDSVDYELIFDESDDMFKIGASNSLETIASQEYVSELLNEELSHKANQTEFTTHVDNNTIHITDVERQNWNEKQDALTVDSELSSTSTNLVQNKAIKNAIDATNTNLTTHTNNTTNHITATEREQWNNHMTYGTEPSKKIENMVWIGE